ncbi:MAG: phospholipase A [Rugosibacter sp.]
MSNYLFFICRWLLLAALLPWALPATAGPDWLIATGDETAQAGEPLLLEVVKPATLADWPTTLTLRLTQAGAPQEVSLKLTVAETGDKTGDTTRRTYHGTVPQGLSGMVRAELSAPAQSLLTTTGSPAGTSNRLALVIANSSAALPASAPAPIAAPPVEVAAASAGAVLSPFVSDASVLSPHEPMYFVVGDRGGVNARFQLSLKYHILDPQSYLAQWAPLLSQLYFAYTQNSTWDLDAESKSFRDTSYRPSLFWQTELSGQGRVPKRLHIGYEHESNGKSGVDSRSVDMLFVRPIWRKEFSNGSALTFAPKFYGYVDKTDNPDIQRYRGYVDWALRYGYEDGWLLNSQLRRGTANRGSVQLDVSVPFRTPVFTRTGGFLTFQLFSGYGENLLDYNVQRSTQLRVGFSIVR